MEIGNIGMREMQEEGWLEPPESREREMIQYSIVIDSSHI